MGLFAPSYCPSRGVFGSISLDARDKSWQALGVVCPVRLVIILHTTTSTMKFGALDIFLPVSMSAAREFTLVVGEVNGCPSNYFCICQ